MAMGEKVKLHEFKRYFFLECLGLFIKDDDEVDLNAIGGVWGDFFFPPLFNSHVFFSYLSYEFF